MSACVLDASVTMSWLSPDEITKESQRILECVITEGAIAPILWGVEIRNALLMAKRRKRLEEMHLTLAFNLLNELPIIIEPLPDNTMLQQIFSLATMENLTMYDACYLQCAKKRALPLATFDTALMNAAMRQGVEILKK